MLFSFLDNLSCWQSSTKFDLQAIIEGFYLCDFKLRKVNGITVQRNKPNQKKITLLSLQPEHIVQCTGILNQVPQVFDKLMAFFQFIIFDVRNPFLSVSFEPLMDQRGRAKGKNYIACTYFEIRIDSLFFERADYQQRARFDAYHSCIRRFFAAKKKST